MTDAGKLIGWNGEEFPSPQPSPQGEGAFLALWPRLGKDLVMFAERTERLLLRLGV